MKITLTCRLTTSTSLAMAALLGHGCVMRNSEYGREHTQESARADLIRALRAAPSASGRPEFPPIPAPPTEETDWGPEFHARHPVLRHPAGGNAARYGQDLLKKYTPEQLAALTPRQVPGNTYTNCPQCLANGVEYRWQGAERHNWQWDAKQPEQVTCKKCQTVYPNERYPMDQRRVYLNPFGGKVEIAFHKETGGKEREFFLDALVDTCKDRFLRTALRHLAYAFHEKGDEKAGEAGVAILEGYAKSVPHWLTYGAHGWGQREGRGYISTGGPFLRDGKYEPYGDAENPHPYSWEAGRGPYFSWWFRSMAVEWYTAYDMIYRSRAFDGKRSPDGKHSYRFWIENSIFDNQAEYMLAFPWAGHIRNNLPLHISDLTKVAMVCGRPQYARFARDWCRLVFYDYMSHHDMVTLEGPGYHNCWIGHGRPTYEALGQYNDPPGYVDEQGVSLIGFDPREEPMKRRQFWGASMMHFPDGSSYPIGDSKRGSKGSMARPLRRSTNRIAPGFGLTVLGDGTLEDNNQVQAILSWNAGGHSHSHEDVHNLILFANGRELFSDMYAGWAARMTCMHNTVAIDGKNNAGKQTAAGSLELYTPKLPGVALVRVEARMAAYPDDDCSRYRRTLVHNTVDLAHPYVLDIFEVRGGSKHDYYLQGSSEKEYPQKGSTSLKLGDFTKLAPENPESIKGWDGFENLKSAAMTNDGYVDFRFEDEPQMGTRTHFQQDEALSLILGEAPNMMFRTNSGYSQTWRKHMPEYKTVPKLVLRHEGEAGLSTLYVLVHEVLDGPSVVTGIKHQVNADGVLSVAVDLGERRDYYAIALEEPGALASGPLAADGVFAAAVTRDGKADVWMAEATRAECLGRSIKADEPALTGAVERVVRMEDGAPRDAYLTDAKLPPGDALRHETVMLEFLDADGNWQFTLASEIEDVVADGDRRWVTLKQDAGVFRTEAGSWEEIFYPRRQAASCRLKVITSSTTVPQLQWTPSRTRHDHYDANCFVAVDEATTLRVEAENAEASITVTGDLTAASTGFLELEVAREANLVLKASNPQGVMDPRPENVQILPPLKAHAVAPATLEPGVVRTHTSGRVDLTDAATLSQRGKAIVARIDDSMPIGRSQSLLFDGYLHAPASGKYTFYTRTAGGCSLTLGDTLIHDAPDFEREEEFASHIYLEKGPHTIRFGFGHSRETGIFTLRWSGPGFNRQPIPPSALFHLPESFYGSNALEETLSPASTIRHPGGLQSAAMLRALKASLDARDAERLELWDAMIRSGRGRIDKTDWRPGKVVKQEKLGWCAGMSGAGALRYVLDWIMTGNRKAEKNAIAVFNSWAQAESFERNAEDKMGHHRLVGGITLGSLANAAELLMSSGTSWPVAEQREFKETWRQVLLPIVTENRPYFFNGNWDLACAWTILASAVMLDDRELFDKEIAYLQTGNTNANFSIYLLPSGQCQETGRDQVHTQMGIYFAALCAQIAWNQGIDLYEGEDYSLGRCFEHAAAYNLGEDRVPYRIYNEAVGRSSRHQSPVPSPECRG